MKKKLFELTEELFKPIEESEKKNVRSVNKEILFLFDDEDEVKHIRDGKLVVKCRQYVYRYKSYMYLLSNGLWYLEGDLNYV